MKLLLSFLAISFSNFAMQVRAADLQDRLGAEAFLDDAGFVIGVAIPAWHEGFGPDVSIPIELRNDFNDTKPHPENDVLNAPLSQLPEDLEILGTLPRLHWVKYCGATSRIIPLRELHRKESARISALEEALSKTETIKAVAIFDVAIPDRVLTQLMKHKSIETILLVGCFTEDGAGEFSRTPDTQIKLKHDLPEEQ